jgi:hypothetical protein
MLQEFEAKPAIEMCSLDDAGKISEEDLSVIYEFGYANVWP